MRHRVSDVSEQEAAADGTSSSEYVDILARRVVFSRTHTLLCTSVILAGVVEVLWILLPTPSSSVGRLPDHWLFGAVETYVTIGLLGELLLRLALQRRGFWRNRANLFDASVVGISLLSSYHGAQIFEAIGIGDDVVESDLAVEVGIRREAVIAGSVISDRAVVGGDTSNRQL